ncbi:MAG: hypothetical protein MJ162_03450 [Treponema sp.]|nr:hypothetical protein [Treponema sp.]
MDKQYQFAVKDLESQISDFHKKGITEFTLHDASVSKDKRQILKIINLFAQKAPDIYLNLLVDASAIDKEVVLAATQIFCSIDVPLECSNKGGKLLFDKKFYANKANLLNEYGLVFGFYLTYATAEGDSLKNFMDRLDFAVNQYPNHIDFPQTENLELEQTAKVSGIFSAKDIRYCRDVAFSCRTFYSAGRAVPWFLSALKPLRIYASRFFADFAEWQRCNNCDFKSGFTPEAENHKSIEKMQLLFLDEKYEEKGQHSLIPLVHDIVQINGVLSRLAGEGETAELETVWNPEELMSPEAMDLQAFAENICMEHCKTRFSLDEAGELNIEAL